MGPGCLVIIERVAFYQRGHYKEISLHTKLLPLQAEYSGKIGSQCPTNNDIIQFGLDNYSILVIYYITDTIQAGVLNCELTLDNTNSNWLWQTQKLHTQVTDAYSDSCILQGIGNQRKGEEIMISFDFIHH